MTNTNIADKGSEKNDKRDVTPEKPVKKEISLLEKSHNPEKTERSVSYKQLKTPKQELENKPTKKSERPEKNNAERSDMKSSKNASSGADTNNTATKSCNKKGRQTNTSLSSVIDTTMNHTENGVVKYRRVTAP